MRLFGNREESDGDDSVNVEGSNANKDSRDACSGDPVEPETLDTGDFYIEGMVPSPTLIVSRNHII